MFYPLLFNVITIFLEYRGSGASIASANEALDEQRDFNSQSEYYNQDHYKQHHHLSHAANTQTNYLNQNQGNPPYLQHTYHPNQSSYPANQQPYQY